MYKIKLFEKKEKETTYREHSILAQPIKRFHRLEPIGIILYKDKDRIIEAYNYIIASKKYRNVNNVIKNVNYDINKSNIDDLILYLSRAIDFRISVKKLTFLYNKRSNDINIYSYPGMIIIVYGYIRKILSKNTFILEYDDVETKVNLIENNILYKELKFIINRFVFIIGNIDSLEKELSITALGVLI